MEIFNLFVKLLDGNTVTLKLSSPIISGESIKNHLYKVTRIPPHHQRLCTGNRQIFEETQIKTLENGWFPTVHLLLRLLGGKGGFGSLLRGAATKAGQKKTNNFDACRDMSGRRLRHVNAEKKLEEWKAEAEDRKLEKIAEDFIKKKAKAVKKSGSCESQKYIEKYREDSAKCVEGVEASVRESFDLYENSKRKLFPAAGSTSKRLKKWMGKEKDDSDSDEEEDGDEDDSDGDGDDEKSVVLDDGNHLVQNNEGEESSVLASVSSSGQLDGESSGGDLTQNNSGEENGFADQGVFELRGSSGCGAVNAEANMAGELALEIDEGSVVQSTIVSDLEMVVAPATKASQAEGNGESVSVVCEETVDPTTNIRSLEVGEGSENKAIDATLINFIDSKSEVKDSVVVPNTSISILDKPINFDEFNSASDMEVLGMERLKTELRTCGLKCGGTLQERAARLFLLKTTPIEMLPKKLLAKK